MSANINFGWVKYRCFSTIMLVVNTNTITNTYSAYNIITMFIAMEYIYRQWRQIFKLFTEEQSNKQIQNMKDTEVHIH